MRSFCKGNHGGLAIPPFSDYVDARVLAAGTAEVHPVPADAVIVFFSSTSDFYVRYGTGPGVTVTVPSADVADGTAGALNPTGRSLARLPDGTPITHLALIAPAACVVTMEFYKA